MKSTTARRFGSSGKSFTAPSAVAPTIGAALLASGTSETADTAWSPSAACLLPDILPVAGTLLSYGGSRQLASGGTVTHSGSLYIGGDVCVLNTSKIGWQANSVTPTDAYFVRNAVSSVGVKGASGIDGTLTCGDLTASGIVSCLQVNGVGTGYSVGVFGPSADITSGYRNLDINAPSGLPVLQFKTNGTLRSQHYWASGVFNIYSAGNHALTSSSATQMLGFGGLMVGTPALKRVLNTLQVRLGDDSNFADISTGAITASGQIYSTAGTAMTVPAYRVADSGYQTGVGSTGALVSGALISNSIGVMSWNFSLGLILKSTLPLSWSDADINGAADVLLYRGGAGILQQRNGLNAQCKIISKSYTSDSSQEALMLDAGKQVAGNLGLYSYRGTSGGSNYPIQIGMLAADGTTFSGVTVGTSGDIMASGNVTLEATKYLNLAGAGVSYIYGSILCTAGNRVEVYSGGRIQGTFGYNFGYDGLILGNGTYGPMLWMGGTTSAFPALKRSGTTTAFRLADDSADGPISCGAITASGNLTLSDTNLITGTTTGTIIATANSQKLGFWGATPIVQPTPSVAAATLVSNGGTPITSTDTFDGYTLQQIARALRLMGKFQ